MNQHACEQSPERRSSTMGRAGLVLQRKPVFGQRALQVAVEAEMAWLLAECGLNHRANDELRNVPAGQIQLSTDNNPAHLGQQITRRLYGGINQ